MRLIRPRARRRSPRALTPTTAAVALAALVAFPHTVEGFWRMPCKNALVVERADPLTNPGATSGHAHHISGGSNFNLDMTFEDARAGTCTSCQIKQDMSNYWVPALYFAWGNGSFSLVDGTLLVYYMQRTHADDKGAVTAFPEGFRMLAGNPYLRSYDDSNVMAQNMIFNCINDKQIDKTHNMPTQNCESALRYEIMFPSCWDGENVDSTNHQSHMAYPDGEFGPCPSSHPERLITIFYELWWSTNAWVDKWDEAANTSQPFVLAMGDPTGYGLHGDFLNGWDIDVLQEAIDKCTSDTGIIDECTVFDLYDYKSFDVDATCTQSSAVDEAATGTLDQLPGCNPIDYGPGDVTVCSEDNPPSLNDQITIGGGLAGGGKTIDVAKSNSGGSGGGGSGGGESGGSSETSSKTKGGSGASASSPAPSKSAGAASPGSSSSSGGNGSSGQSSSSSADSSSASSTPQQGNMLLWVGLIGGGLVLLCIIICLACRFQCGRRRKRLDQQIPSVDEEPRGEKKRLQDTSSSDSSDDSDTSSDEDDRASRRRR
ncbi:hypothetical protein JCM11641_006158 [Rhodosporidiobolus odoratus]